MPTSDAGKAIASRNATTHGLFTRDVVLPSLGEDPEGYRQLEAEWLAQLPPRNLLERHYVEKIAAASWRLRRFHRWEAQLFEDDTLTESERLDRLDKALRHETALHRQIDTAVKMLNKDVAQLYTQRARDQVLADTRTAEREYKDCHEDAVHVDLRMQDIHYRVRKSTEEAVNNLSEAPLDTCLEEITLKTEAIEPHDAQICQNELPLAPEDLVDECILEYEQLPGSVREKCKNELLAPPWNAQRITECLDEEFTRRHLSEKQIKNYGPHPLRM